LLTISHIVEKLLTFLITSFPLLIVTIPRGSYVIFVILLLSIFWIFSKKINIFSNNRNDNFFLSIFIFYFLIQVIYFFFFESNIRELDTPSRFILLLPLFFILREIPFSFENFSMSLNLSSIFAGLLAIYQVLTFGSFDALGFLDKGSFSLLASIFASFSLFKCISSNNLRIKMFYIVGVILGIVAMLSSSIRTVWLIFIIVNSLTLIYVKKYTLPKILSAITISVLILYNLFPHIGTESKLLINNTIDYFNNTNFDTSVAHRFEIYKASIKIISDNPMGVGENNFLEYKNRLINEGLVSEKILHHINAHSEILSSLIEQGIPGLIATLLVVLVPLRIFISNFHKCEGAVFGSIFVGHYSLFAITSGIFDYQVSALVYVFFTVIIYGFISKSGNVST